MHWQKGRKTKDGEHGLRGRKDRRRSLGAKEVAWPKEESLKIDQAPSIKKIEELAQVSKLSEKSIQRRFQALSSQGGVEDFVWSISVR